MLLRVAVYYAFLRSILACWRIYTMTFPKELSIKYRVNQVLINDTYLYRAKVFDFTLNKVVLLTVIGNIEHSVFDALKNKLDYERKLDKFDFILEVFSLERLINTNGLYYTQECADPLASIDPTTIIGNESIRDWFYKLALPTFYKFLNLSNQKNTFHGILSPNTVYYCDNSFKIGDYILGVILELNPQLIIDSPWYCELFFNPALNGVNSDTYSLLKFLQFIDTDNYSKIFNITNTICRRTDTDESVKEIIRDIFINKYDETLVEKYLSTMRPFLESHYFVKNDRILYKPNQLPLLYDMISSWDLSDFSKIAIVHINHYLSDIIEFNNVLASMFEHLVYIVVPYSIETRILPSNSYHMYYHEILNEKYVIKKDTNTIGTATDFYSAMYESIKFAFRDELIPLVKSGKKIIIIEDGGFHYNVIDDLIKTYPILESAIIGAIEQTTSGIKRYKNAVSSINIPYPVLSVARSKIKMRLESHFIARRVIDELNYLLYMANSFLSFHNILVIGYGIIGRNISQALFTLKSDISVYDIDDSILSIAKGDGLKVIDNAQSIEFTDNLIIIGATGETAFTSSMFFSYVKSDAKKIYLASASSKRIEFQSIVDFFEVGDKDNSYKHIIDEMENIRITQKDYGIIYSFCYKNIDKEIVLIANGYPVNFYRKNIISLTESVIDLIYCEIFMLIQYLLDKKIQLKSKLYLLGSSDFNSLEVQEEQLVRSWFSLLALRSDCSAETIWNRFDVHPLEDILREKCLPTNTEGVTK